MKDRTQRSRRGRLWLALLAPAVLALVAVAAASCNQTPVNVAVRSFEQAQKIDVVCIHVNDANGSPLPTSKITPLTQDNCFNVPDTTDAGSPLPNHLYAVVTQVTRGELAVVDLTAGDVVDEGPSTPGVNVIPLGPVPTDVKTEPDGKYTFVSSADPSKPAIYGIDNTRLLGTSQGTPPPAPLKLTDLSACALPQPPQALVVEPSVGSSGFVLVAMLREFAGLAPKVAAIDISALVGEPHGTLSACRILGYTNLSGATPQAWTPGPTWPDGVPYVDGGVDIDGDVPPLGPSCSGSGSAGGAGEPASGDGGIPLAVTIGAEPAPLYMATRDDRPIVYVADSMLPLIHVVDLSDPTAPKELQPLLATSLVNPQRAVTVGQLAVSPVTRDFKRYLYAVDRGTGSLIVYDVTDPVASPHMPMVRPHAELNPLADPDRITFTAPVATLAFAMHDWSLADQTNASNPMIQSTGLLCNPNPYAHPDAGLFLDNGAYYRADQASLIQTNGTAAFLPMRLRGVFGFATLSNGNIVVIDVDDWDAPCRRPDPMATMLAIDHLGNQTYTTTAMGTQPASFFGQTGALDVPEPAALSSTDLDPYHAPLTYNSLISESPAVTEEAFFPVSAPNRVRSSFLLENDPAFGSHLPAVLSAPQLVNLNNSAVPLGAASPLILATALPTGWFDPAFVSNPTEPNPGVRIPTTPTAPVESGNNSELVPAQAETDNLGASVRVSLDDPTAHVDQDWTVTYEGALGSVSGINGALSSDDGYRTMTLAAPNSQLCERGIEDWRVGQQRAGAVIAALGSTALSVPPPQDPPGQSGCTTDPNLPADLSLKNWTGDYIQITDDLLPSFDQYWTQPTKTPDGAPDNACWDGPLANDTDPNIGQNRYNACDRVFGTSYVAEGVNGQSYGDLGYNVNIVYARDFPILEAYDDHLVLGRFYWPAKDWCGNTVSEQTTNRIIVGPDPGNAASMRFAQCCFHSQAGFAVRAGGEWVANGSSLGLLHHVETDPSTGACVLSCDPRLALANARSFDLPWATFPNCQANGLLAPGRDSVLALRNPMFSYVTWSGCGAPASNVDHTTTARDDSWRFSIRGSFAPLTMSLTQGTNVPVSPQSMLFISSLQQLAVVDGQQQGLVVFDLNTLAFAHTPYF